MKDYEFIIVMPVFNEEDGIQIFLKSLMDRFANRCLIIIVDDKSLDGTVNQIKLLENQDLLILVELPENLGHGGAFLHGLKFSLQFQSNIVISADGDGQITPQVIQEMFDAIKLNPESVLELIRLNRLDGPMRKFITLGTRVLVLLKSGKLPEDANTPFRAYNRKILSRLLELVPNDTLVPNLWLSILTRRQGIRVIKLKALSQPRIGLTKTGSTWNGGIYNRYKKLIIFSSRATLEFLKN
jgi:glycosyltransferase involved in cell wall biosynthesis